MMVRMKVMKVSGQSERNVQMAGQIHCSKVIWVMTQKLQRQNVRQVATQEMIVGLLTCFGSAQSRHVTFEAINAETIKTTNIGLIVYTSKIDFCILLTKLSFRLFSSLIIFSKIFAIFTSSTFYIYILFIVFCIMSQMQLISKSIVSTYN